MGDHAEREARRVAPLFDGSRLRRARDLQRQTQVEVATKVGISAEAISQFERGVARPSASTLLDLARRLDVPVGFLVTDPEETGQHQVEAFFRSLRSAPAVERRSARASAHLLWRLVRQLRHYIEFPEVSIPRYPIRPDEPNPDLERIAIQVREDWGVEPGPIRHVVRTLEQHGVVVVRHRLLTKRLDAFSVPFPDEPLVILVADKQKRDRSRFDAAHELGHLVTHEPNIGQISTLERQAHGFAAAFLMPERDIKDDLPTTPEWDHLVELKGRWGTSIAALVYRCMTLEVWDQPTYERAMKYMSARGWRKHEPGDLGSPEQPRLLQAALDLLVNAGVTIEDLTKEANLPVSYIHELVGLLEASRRPSVDL